MRIPKIYPEHTQISGMNRIDHILKALVTEGTIKNPRDNIFNSAVGMETSGLWCQEYWDIFVGHLSSDDIIFVLSHEQHGNWNHCLYTACENKWEEIVSQLDKELFDAEQA